MLTRIHTLTSSAHSLSQVRWVATRNTTCPLWFRTSEFADGNNEPVRRKILFCLKWFTHRKSGKVGDELMSKPKKRYKRYVRRWKEEDKLCRWETDCNVRRGSRRQRRMKKKVWEHDVVGDVMHWGDVALVRGQQEWEEIPWSLLLYIRLLVY